MSTAISKQAGQGGWATGNVGARGDRGQQGLEECAESVWRRQVLPAQDLDRGRERGGVPPGQPGKPRGGWEQEVGSGQEQRFAGDSGRSLWMRRLGQVRERFVGRAEESEFL